MRRTLLTGLGLTLGIFASPAFGQDSRTTPQPMRAAKLNGIIGIPDNSDTVQAVSPATLLAANQDIIPTVPTVPSPLSAAQVPTPMPMPPGAVNPPGGVPMPLPAPRQVTPGPSVTEVRTPDGAPVTPPGYPYPFELATPTVVPSVIPNGGYPIDPCAPGECLPGGAAVNRLNCGNHWFGSAEYLMWWTRSMQVPTLLTTSAPSSFGILGDPTTRSLFGGDVGNTYHGGGRFGIGRWFCDDPSWGVEGRIFFLGGSESSFSANSSEYPVLARPFYNVNSPVGQFSELISYPGLATGSALIKTSTSLWGAEANLRRVLYGNPNGSGFELDALVGYRFVDLDEHLSIEEAFARTPGSNMGIGTPAIAGNVTDTFHTTDYFNGGQIGLHGSYTYGKWSVDGRATVAFGDLEQTAIISGGQTLYFPNGAVGKYNGGLLALPGANIGTWRHNQFSVLPEVSLNLGYQVTSHMRAFIGYDFLFIGNTLRPGGTIDTSIDAARIPNFPLPGSPTVLPGAPRPGPYFTTSDFFAQGINFGLEFRW